MRKQLFRLSAAVSLFAVLLIPTAASAASTAINFESPTYTIGNINGQDGWNKTGPFDAAVVANTYGFTSFNGQTLRISNAVTSGSFGDQTFSKSLTNEAGETLAENGGLSGGTRQNHFEAQFSLATTKPTEQAGLVMSTSPDRGDGARMSYLRFEDKPDGVHVFFDGYQDNAPLGAAIGDVNGCGAEDDFIETDIATLSRTAPHTIKFAVDFVDGTNNDVVKVYIDGTLKTTGGSWEDYFRYCEGNETRTVDSLLFRVGGAAAPTTIGEGFLIDNLTLSSSATPTVPTTKDQCKNDGYKNLINNQGNIFKNQGKCIEFVEKHSTTVQGGVQYFAYSTMRRQVEFLFNTGDNRGTFHYSDANHESYRVKISETKVDGNFAWFAGEVFNASNPANNGKWLFAKVENSHPDKIWGSFTDETAAKNGVKNMTAPGDGPFNIVNGQIKFKHED